MSVYQLRCSQSRYSDLFIILCNFYRTFFFSVELLVCVYEILVNYYKHLVNNIQAREDLNIYIMQLYKSEISKLRNYTETVK